ncbi:MAG: UMP kinase [Thermodesulfobacteriota bacterium]|nr:UMP kinase [Thermodesulfobacteriota bacterium]
MSAKYSSILLKLSGEALAGDRGFGVDECALNTIVSCIQDAVETGCQTGVVIGGGNIHRGAGALSSLNRVRSDKIGMLATLINALRISDVLEQRGIECRVMSAFEASGIAETYVAARAVKHMQQSRVVIYAGGTGCPFFTTDTAAALRALETGAQVMIKATKVSGIYDRDPVVHPEAVFFKDLDYDQVLGMDLKVMDAAAVSLCRDNNLELRVIDVTRKGNLSRLLNGEDVGSVVRAKRGEK